MINNPELSWRQIVAISAVGAGVSLTFTGFVFGISNNQFHLPIVESLYDQPQFVADGFVQSLRFYSSGVMILLRGSSRYIDPYWTFLAGAYVARILMFTGLLLCASTMGVRTMRDAATFAAFICFASILRGSTAAGDAGLFTNNFSPSDLGNGLVLFAIYFMARKRIDLPLIFVGITFFVNAFMAVWLVLPLAFAALAQLRGRDVSLRVLIRQSAIGLVGCGVFLLPVVLNLLENPGFGAKYNFNYATFLRFYYPAHFFADAISVHEYAILGAVVLLGAVSCLTLGAAAKPFRIMFLGAVATYCIGVLLPLWTNSQLLLNLHLLRSGLVIYLFAALFSSLLATRWLAAADGNRLFGHALAICLCTIKSMVPLAILLIVGARFWKPSDRWRLQPAGSALLLVPLLGFLLYKGVGAWQANADQSSAIQEWNFVGTWAHQNTPPSSIFLLPTISFQQEASANGNSLYLGDSAVFLYVSQRGIRGNFKDGAAVMWSTPYYKTWKSEIDAGLANQSLSAMQTSARSRGIDYTIYPCAAPRAQEFPVFRNGHICVFSNAM